MALLTPRCAWCGAKWKAQVVYPTMKEYRIPPATSERFPTLHLHFDCAADFRRAVVEECHMIPSPSIFTTELT
jgi:hypothetical protein